MEIDVIFSKIHLSYQKYAQEMKTPKIVGDILDAI